MFTYPKPQIPKHYSDNENFKKFNCLSNFIIFYDIFINKIMHARLVLDYSKSILKIRFKI